MSNDFFYYAIFPFIALCYGKHKIAGIIACLACISVSVGHNLWASLDLNAYISQTYKIYSAWPADRKHDPYFPVWARYHSHGVGILFGWFLLEERKNQFFSKFLGRRGGLVKFLIVLGLYSVAVFTLYFPIYGINACFHVEWEDGVGDYFNVSTSKTHIILRFKTYEHILVESVSGCMTKNGELDWVAISIWNAIHRPLWCIGVGTIAVICDLNYGFLINWFLSCKVKFDKSNESVEYVVLDQSQRGFLSIFQPLLFVAKLSYCMYLFHMYIIGMWQGNIKFDSINDVWFFSFIFSGFVLFVIIASAIWHVLFEAPFGTAWTEVFKMITLAMNPPRKSQQKVAEEKSVTDEQQTEGQTEQEIAIQKHSATELKPREDVEIESEKQQSMQAAAEF